MAKSASHTKRRQRKTAGRVNSPVVFGIYRLSKQEQVTYTRAKTRTQTILRSVGVRLQTSDRIALLMIVIGLLMVSISVTHRILRYRSLSVGQQVATAYQEPVTRKPKPTRIYIQWFVDTEIEGRTFVNNTWSISENKATFLLDSARPGEPGNIILYGHNTREILGNIRALKGQERITITTEDASTHSYKVAKLSEVDPSDTKAIQPTDTETLTIYTCSGFLDSKRFIVTAYPISETE